MSKWCEGYKLDCFGEDLLLTDLACLECSDVEDCFERKYLRGGENVWLR